MALRRVANTITTTWGGATTVGTNLRTGNTANNVVSSFDYRRGAHYSAPIRAMAADWRWGTKLVGKINLIF